MAKNIVFCADGTWDSTTDNTNPYKLFKACLTTATQVPYYDDGVGADGNEIQKLAGGAFGAGLFQKIKDGYSKIAQVYEAGDKLFIFGFSRGAYTARSLAGMVAAVGLPTEHFDDAFVESAFQAYRDRANRASIVAGLQAQYAVDEAMIWMVGVWDTVGSLGIPALVGGIDPLEYQFLDTSLNAKVVNAYQALAIDERRVEFPPTLWTLPATPPAGQTMEQVWFTGVHCDVGGGYPETGLSNITLSWMMGKAMELGLQLDQGAVASYAPIDAKHALDTKHESWSVLWGFPRAREIANNSAISNSVQLRFALDAQYRPSTLVFSGSGLSSGYTVVDVVEIPLAAS
jgi:uncharacterized protein (DUF2235 family)